MSNKESMKDNKHIDPDTGQIRDTLVIPPHATPQEVHEYFHSPIDPLDDHQPTSWSEYKANRINPGPVRVATQNELATYNALLEAEGEQSARDWLTEKWRD